MLRAHSYTRATTEPHQLARLIRFWISLVCNRQPSSCCPRLLSRSRVHNVDIGWYARRVMHIMIRPSAEWGVPILQASSPPSARSDSSKSVFNLSVVPFDDNAATISELLVHVYLRSEAPRSEVRAHASGIQYKLRCLSRISRHRHMLWKRKLRGCTPVVFLCVPCTVARSDHAKNRSQNWRAIILACRT